MVDEAATTLKHALQLMYALQLTRPLRNGEKELLLRTLLLLQDVFGAIGDTASAATLEIEIEAARSVPSKSHKLGQHHRGPLGYISQSVWGLKDRLWALL